MEQKVIISIVIPVKDGISTLADCLAGIRSQTLYNQCEIIVIDSGSTDGTVVFLESQKDVKLFQIPPANFNHGLTRNYGVTLARGEFVVMTVQDATAADERWLEKMRRHFDDPQVSGVCGQQVVPHHLDKNPHEWFRPVGPPGVLRVGYSSAEEFNSLTPVQKKNACSWDDVSAMYRKEALVSIPFREAFFAEDMMWAQDALRAGRALVYDTNSRVYHYHFQTYDYTYKRMLTQLYFAYKLFGHARRKTGANYDYIRVVYRNFRYRAALKWIRHNLQAMHARDRAFRDFHDNLALGEASLDLFYGRTCAVPPLGRAK